MRYQLHTADRPAKAARLTWRWWSRSSAALEPMTKQELEAMMRAFSTPEEPEPTALLPEADGSADATGPALRFRLAATLPEIERVCDHVRTHLRHARYDADRFAIMLLLREALNNAIFHGCAQDPRLRVDAQVTLGACEVTIAVKDPGPGFDWRTALAQDAQPCATSGMGVRLYRHYASAIAFSDRGNRVTLTRVLRGKERYV